MAIRVGTLYSNAYDPTGNPGEYAFNNATFNCQNDFEGLGGHLVDVGFWIYIQALNSETFEPQAGIFHRYKLTTVTHNPDGTLSGIFIWDEKATESDYPAPGAAIVSQPDPEHRYGYPLDKQIYPELPYGAGLAVVAIDNWSLPTQGFSAYSQDFLASNWIMEGENLTLTLTNPFNASNLALFTYSISGEFLIPTQVDWKASASTIVLTIVAGSAFDGKVSVVPLS